jgi:Chlorophyll A-B binding protein
MKIALLASLLATAAAFAPAQQRASTTALAVVAPGVGDEVWDPLGLYTLGSGKAFDTFPNMFPNEQFLIEAETKHGRMAMLGWTGIWATTEVSGCIKYLNFTLYR